MEIDGKTAAFYGDLVEAGMDKDIPRMFKLIDKLTRKQALLLCVALENVSDLALVITKVKENGN